MGTVGTLGINLTARTRGFEAQLARAGRDLREFEQRAETAGSKAGAAFASGLAAGGAVGGGLAGAAAAALAPKTEGLGRFQRAVMVTERVVQNLPREIRSANKRIDEAFTHAGKGSQNLGRRLAKGFTNLRKSAIRMASSFSGVSVAFQGVSFWLRTLSGQETKMSRFYQRLADFASAASIELGTQSVATMRARKALSGMTTVAAIADRALRALDSAVIVVRIGLKILGVAVAKVQAAFRAFAFDPGIQQRIAGGLTAALNLLGGALSRIGIVFPMLLDRGANVGSLFDRIFRSVRQASAAFADLSVKSGPSVGMLRGLRFAIDGLVRINPRLARALGFLGGSFSKAGEGAGGLAGVLKRLAVRTTAISGGIRGMAAALKLGTSAMAFMFAPWRALARLLERGRFVFDSIGLSIRLLATAVIAPIRGFTLMTSLLTTGVIPASRGVGAAFAVLRAGVFAAATGSVTAVAGLVGALTGVKAGTRDLGGLLRALGVGGRTAFVALRGEAARIRDVLRSPEFRARALAAWTRGATLAAAGAGFLVQQVTRAVTAVAQLGAGLAVTAARFAVLAPGRVAQGMRVAAVGTMTLARAAGVLAGRLLGVKKTAEGTIPRVSALGLAARGAAAGFGILRGAVGVVLGPLRKIGGLISTFGTFALFAGTLGGSEKFERGLTKSLAIMRATEDQQKRMKKVALDLSRVTQFSAAEMGESYFFLASAGLTAEQSIGALPIVARFAQAGLFDVAQATDLLTDAFSALGLNVGSTQQRMRELQRVSDVLVKANTLANASVEQFATALTNQLGGALKVAGRSIEEGVAVLAAMADQGVKAEEAGTALSTFLLELQRIVPKNADAFRKYGLSLTDATGNLLPLATITQRMTDLLGGMSDVQRGAALDQLGLTKRSLKLAQQLAGTSSAIERYRSELESAGGATDKVAAKQLTPLQRGWERVKSAMVEVGQVVQPLIDQVGKGIGMMADRVVEFARTWRLRWDLLKVNTAIVWNAVVAGGLAAFDALTGIAFDLMKRFEAAGTNIKAFFLAAWDGVGEGARVLVRNFDAVAKRIGEVFKGLGKGILASLNAALQFEDPVEAFRDSFNSALTDLNWESVSDRAGLAFQRTLSRHMADRSVFGDVGRSLDRIMESASDTFVDRLDQKLFNERRRIQGAIEKAVKPATDDGPLVGGPFRALIDRFNTARRKVREAALGSVFGLFGDEDDAEGAGAAFGRGAAAQRGGVGAAIRGTAEAFSAVAEARRSAALADKSLERTARSQLDVQRSILDETRAARRNSVQLVTGEIR